MDAALIRSAVGFDLAKPGPGLDNKPVSEEEYKKIVKSFEGQDEPEEEREIEEVTVEQYKKYVQYTLLKLLESPGWKKGYKQNVKKALEVEPHEKETMKVIDEEIEQTMFEITNAAAVKYNINTSHPFDKNKY